MRLFEFVFFIGLTLASASTWQWETGKEHVFDYSGRILTGIPKLSSQYSGIGIKCEVVIQANSLEDLRLTLKHVYFTRVNDRLHETEDFSSTTGRNWRNLVLPSYKQAPENIKDLLHMPMKFSVKDGEIRAITVSGAEEEWSLNFKKALIILFQTKMERSTLDVDTNTINKHSYETKNYWKVSEETIDGVCDVIYQVNELPDYFIKENVKMMPHLESCSSPKYFEITKTKDLESCTKSAIYNFIKPSYTGGCSSPRCLGKSFGTASSVTRYYACGSRNNLLIQSIVNEGELVQRLTGLKTESSVTGTRQTLRLKDIKTIQKPLPEPTEPRRIESVMYEYIPKGETLRNQIGLVPKISQSELRKSLVYKYLPRHFLPNPSNEKTKTRMSSEKISEELKELITKVMKDMKRIEDLPQKQLPMKMISIVRGMTLMKVEDMKTLYEELKGSCSDTEERQMLRNIYFDSIAISGTTPAVMFLTEMIKSEEMSMVQATSILMMLPHYVITPSKEVFTSLFELIKSEVISRRRIMYNSAVLSMSNLVQKACLDRYRKSTYPTNIFGEFCDPSSEIVTEMWMPYLNHKLRTSKHTDQRNLYIIALGALSHKDVIPMMLPYLEGNGVIVRPEYHSRSEFSYHNITRFVTVYSMTNTGFKHPELVLPIMLSIYSNPAETSDMRIAAFNTLMKLNPSMTYLQKIAAITWSERDMVVLRFVYTTIHSLSTNSEIISIEPDRINIDMIKKSKLILPLLKKVEGYIPSTNQWVSSDYLPWMDAGYKSTVSWISSHKTFLPNEVFSEFKYIFGDVETKPFTFFLKTNGMENLYQKFDRLFSGGSHSLNPTERREKWEELPGELKEMITRFSEEKQDQLLTLSITEIRRFSEFSEEQRMKIMNINEHEMRKIVSIYSKEKRIEYLELPDEERTQRLVNVSTGGGRYTTQSREEAMRMNKYRGEEESTSRSDTNGMSKSGYEHFRMHFDHIKDNVHKEWSKVVEQLKIETRENGPLTSLVYLNLFDDVSIFGSISDISTETIREKIRSVLRNPTYYSEKMCGKTPISFQRMLNVAPSEFLIPSDMGFPIIIESNMPMILSVRGHMEIICSSTTPTMVLNSKIISTNSYQSMVGTYCPFTDDMVTTGFKEDFIINLPLHLRVKYEVETGKLRLSFGSVNISKPMDVLHYHSRPFTLHHSYYGLEPRTMTPNIKYIKSTSAKSRVDYPFGGSFGVNFKSILESESSHLDLSYAMRLSKMYNNNPMNMIRFWMNPGVNEYNEPTIRNHMYRIEYNPYASKTSEVELEFGVGVASKRPSEEPLYHHFTTKSSQEMQRESTLWGKIVPYTFRSLPISEIVHPTQQTALKEVMVDKLRLSSGAGMIFYVTTTLKGGTPRKVTYQFVYGVGRDINSRRLWNIELVSEPKSPSMTQKICLYGHADIPTVPTWDIDMIRSTDLRVRFENTLGFGRTCNESRIRTTGTAKVTEQQKLYSRTSPASQECDRLRQMQYPGALTSSVCEKSRSLGHMLDDIDTMTEYINTPPAVSLAESKVIEAMRFSLWPYIRIDESYARTTDKYGEKPKINMRLHFNESSKTFDWSITRQGEHVVFRTIPMSYPIRNMLPLVVGQNNIRRGLDVLTGYEWNSQCRVEKSWLRTFDNRSIPFNMDDCYHLITADCSSEYSFGVLAKNIRHTHVKKMKIYLNKTEIVLSPSHDFSSSYREINIKINGTQITMPKDTRKTIPDESHTPVVDLYRSLDGVIHLKASRFYLDLKFDGENIRIDSTPWLKSKMCGVCGSSNGQRLADLAGPRKCIYSRPDVEVASYRIQTPECSVLEGPVKERLRTETQKCARFTVIPTEVYKSFIALVGKCTRREHMVLDRGNEVCFSRIPVVQCGAQCSPKPRQLASKKITFTCLPAGRMANLYHEKAIRGVEMPEFKERKGSFTTSVMVPLSCVSGISGKPMISNSGIPSSIPSGSEVPSGNKTPLTSSMNDIPTGPTGVPSRHQSEENNPQYHSQI